MPEDLLEVMYRALHEKIGIRVSTRDPARTRSCFYANRSRDPSLQNLGLHNSPLANEMFILKRDVLDAHRRARKEDAKHSEG